MSFASHSCAQITGPAGRRTALPGGSGVSGAPFPDRPGRRYLPTFREAIGTSGNFPLGVQDILRDVRKPCPKLTDIRWS
jgi:hypothetical protein